MTRDSVCMADDVDAPHTQGFALAPGATLLDLAQAVARTAYLPMPSDAWGWTIEASGTVVAVRKGLLGRWVVPLRGNPSTVPLTPDTSFCALYVRPGSPWRDA